MNQQVPWSVEESAAVFIHLIERTYLNPSERSRIGFMEFDKDDALALDFVTAASNYVHTYLIFQGRVHIMLKA